MLYPQNNRCRTVLELSGFWKVKADLHDQGIVKGWMAGFEPDAEVGVPGSWNEQLSELGLMNFTGAVWYLTSFCIPQPLQGRRILLRFGAVDFQAQVWINGEPVGEHNGGFLPFEFDVTDRLSSKGENVLVVRTDNRLSHETIPQGVTRADYVQFNLQRQETYPPTVFDFFAYGGISRRVTLTAVHKCHLSSVCIDNSVDGSTGRLNLQATVVNPSDLNKLNISIYDGSTEIHHRTLSVTGGEIQAAFEIPECRLWSPEDPHLYQIRFELLEDESFIDEYFLDIGIREITVEKDRLLLNGKPVFLKGFGKHEDFPVLGKGLSYPLIIKDFQLMKWLGANSFRTSHYPYSEETLQIADRMGFLVIDEAPAVSLNFKYVSEKTLENHKRVLTELIARDRNHPCVISWSIANEPGIWGEAEAISEKAKNYWTEIYEHVKGLDDSRPITLPTCTVWGERDLSYTVSDFISVNRYWGWYEIPANLDKAAEALRKELEALHEKYNKPILVSEFGADTLEGQHSTFPQLFTEEYQTMFIEKYFETIEALQFTIGEHIWNFADFRTAQHYRRVVLNKKGVFNRTREPKSVAFFIRKHWKE